MTDAILLILESYIEAQYLVGISLQCCYNIKQTVPQTHNDELALAAMETWIHSVIEPAGASLFLQ